MSEKSFEEMSDEELMAVDATATPSDITIPGSDEDDIEPEEKEFTSPDGTLEGALDAAAEATPEETPSAEDAASGEGEAEASETEPASDPGEAAETASDGDAPVVEPGSTESDPVTPDHTTPEQSAAPSQEEAAEPEAQAQTAEPSVEDLYKQIMAPFKANGREFQPQSPDEVIRLMQQGANYSKKMEALRPNLRLMKMLENNDLLDESKLNFLIDLNARNPQAIQKLLHESKIDPLDIDTTETPKYTPNNHAVSEQQYAFTEALQDLESTEAGQQTLSAVNNSWDRASKEEIFKDPSILGVIHQQREDGVYDRISNELERQKMFGNFKDVPFIHAYKAVGDYLHQRGELYPQTAEPVVNADPVPTPRPMVETRTATPKAKLANGDRVAGTTPARTSPAPQKRFDPTTMTDEEIMGLTLNS